MTNDMYADKSMASFLHCTSAMVTSNKNLASLITAASLSALALGGCKPHDCGDDKQSEDEQGEDAQSTTDANTSDMSATDLGENDASESSETNTSETGASETGASESSETDTSETDSDGDQCGDGIVAGAEECDDGNIDNTDECLDTCVVATCGDGFVGPGEDCDDANGIDTDGCSNLCVLELAAVSVSTGAFHTCALMNTGNVRCWGDAFLGALGYANMNKIGDNEFPVTAGDVDVGGPVSQVSSGQVHTCALLDTGNVRCWGPNDHGQIGYGNMNTIGDNETPASAGDVDVGGTVIQVSAGQYHTCALLDTGNVRCWGNNGDGQLGYGNTTWIGDNETPASAGDVQVGGTVVHVSVGNEHTCALLANGNVRCWGWNDYGQLGYGNTNWIGDNESPASAGDVQVGGTVVQLSAGRAHNCVLLDNGKVRCWGRNEYGQLGYGNTNQIGDNETPASAGDVQIGGNVVQVVAGNFHTCALLDDGNVRCWGQGASGGLGYGNTNNIGDDETPASAGNVDVGGTVVLMSSEFFNSCALLDNANIRCWGEGFYGSLGYGNINSIGDNETPSSAGDVPYR